LVAAPWRAADERLALAALRVKGGRPDSRLASPIRLGAMISALDYAKRAEIDDTINMLSGNLEKIAEHGQRADNIVTSMLEHSRGSSGERRSVDLNALFEEALNLSYHGGRAQDQSFSIILKLESSSICSYLRKAKRRRPVQGQTPPLTTSRERRDQWPNDNYDVLPSKFDRPLPTRRVLRLSIDQPRDSGIS